MAMSRLLRVGNAQGFWGDRPQAALRLAQQQPDLDYLTLDYLAEVSLSIMAIQRDADPTLGYARDFLDVVRALTHFWKKGSRLKIVTNAGGLNPLACATACQQLLKEAGCGQLRIGVVSGDNCLPLLQQNLADPLYRNLETGEPLAHIADRLVTANAYLGAHPIAELLKSGADLVITGRVADPSLTVGPCIAHFGWKLNEYERLAGATVAGHLIECGTQVTGGILTDWLNVPRPADMGFPVAEIAEEGSCVMTKPPGTGGCVTVETVKEQLLYEIGDPDNYLSPDVTVSFLSLQLEQQGHDRVRITGARGRPPPPTYKVSATYRDGFKAEGLLTIFGQDAPLKAQRCGEMILERMQQAGYKMERSQIDCIGTGAIAKGVCPPKNDLLECVLRVAVADPRREAVEHFTKEIAPLVTSGPQGVTGYTSGRPPVRQVFGYWPCLIECNTVQPKTQLL